LSDVRFAEVAAKNAGGVESELFVNRLVEVELFAQSRDGFGSMIGCAKMLASRLDGKVVDDGDLPLTDEAIGAIAQQVAAFYRDMESAEIPAGSNRALRLFS